MRLAARCALVLTVLSLARAGVAQPVPWPGQGDPTRVVPAPASIEMAGGWFIVDRTTSVSCDAMGRSGASVIAGQLAALRGVSSLDVTPTSSDAPAPGEIRFIEDASVDHPEGYLLEIDRTSVTVRGSTSAGLFYGAQTLRQLLPPELERGRPYPSLEWKVRCARIEDAPRFSYRGVMLDPGRHFLPTPFVFDVIDAMALHKMNVLHMHLTEDQGWRIEIDAYPELTRVGAWRDASASGESHPTGAAHGGFYTKDDLREIIAYASAHHIEVIPEIELPGHCGAALASLPHLSCTGKRRGVSTRWGVHDEVYCVGKETTFEFLQTVLDEVIELFPSARIHIGGDECPRTRWGACVDCQARMRTEGMTNVDELQPYMIHRIGRYLSERGRRLIGWDEILEGGEGETSGLPGDAIVMSWRGMEGGIRAAEAGHDVIMTPTSHCYFDYAQAPVGEPKAIGQRVLTMETVHGFEPVPETLSEEAAARVLGTQANLWGEYVPTAHHASYMLHPRLSALSEVAWMARGTRDIESFNDRLSRMLARLNAMGVHYRDPSKAARAVASWSPETVKEAWAPMLWDVTSHVTGDGAYEVAFRFEGGENRLEIEMVDLVAGGNTAGRDTHRGVAAAYHRGTTYYLTVFRHQPGTSYMLRAKVKSVGGTDSKGTVWMRRVE